MVWSLALECHGLVLAFVQKGTEIVVGIQGVLHSSQLQEIWFPRRALEGD